jgi:two-component system response regulator GlrR
MRILLVDDDQGTRITLGFALARAGLEVHTAADGPEALRLLKEIRFDWLITDGDMVPVDGFSLAAQAVALQPKLRIVMISGVFDEKDLAGCPVQRLFSKPVDAENLLEYLKSAPSAAQPVV